MRANLKSKFLYAFLLLVASAANAQQVVRYEAADFEGKMTTVEAVFRKPTSENNRKALVILHHGGGWGHGTTAQYAQFFSERGFTTLEPRMFNGSRKNELTYLTDVYAALKFLGQQPDVDKNQISVMGLSFGANIVIFSATKWANQKYSDDQLTFKSYAAFYPTCWKHNSLIKRTLPSRFKSPTAPDDLEDTWVTRPLQIFTGTDDDYDERDANACKEFINAIPDTQQREMTTVVQYQGATHGWDQQSRSFYEPGACKGRGCTNNNVSNAEVTLKAKQDLLKFLMD